MEIFYFDVSVIIPVYNSEKYLEKAVLSVVNLPEVKEVILVDDGSKDNSLGLCHRLAGEYEKIVVYTHEGGVNKGPGPTRNEGILRAKYPYISFLDADDVYLPHRFVRTRKVFSDYPDTEGVYECLGTMSTDQKPYTTMPSGIVPHELLTTLLRGEQGHFSIVAWS